MEAIEYPDSLGLFYSAITSFLGFTPNSDEYKVMGLAALGRPTRLEALGHVLQIDPGGSFALDMSYFDYNHNMYSPALGDLLGMDARARTEPITALHVDVAASAQRLLEACLLAVCQRLHDRTGQDALCMAGGVALNCVANARIRAETPFRRVFIQPAAGDAGGAMGAALLAQAEWAGTAGPSAMPHAHLGPSYSPDGIERYLKRMGVRYNRLSARKLAATVADHLAEGKVVGWFQGPMEWGPRALGARSILADPRKASMRETLNRKIKRREPFRPFAPICPWSRAAEFFEVSCPEPFMTFTVHVKKPRLLGAVTHVDGTARLQTIDDDSNLLIAQVLRAFEARTGVPVLINTSFNMAGEPIVCSPADAYLCFREAGIDVLALERFLIIRSEQPSELVTAGSRDYMSIARELRPHVKDTYFFT